MTKAKQKNRQEIYGCKINRNNPIEFTFDGKKYKGYEGDTIASALLANNIMLVARSFKYHRPRGVMTASSMEPNALVELVIKHNNGQKETVPNTKATTQPIYEGLIVKSQNRFPSLRFDFMSINQFLSPFFVAGFYYKTFIFPGLKGWMLYEKIIRRAAGLGKVTDSVDKDLYQKKHVFCDVLIVGAGASGMAAAKKNADMGKKVILVDENSTLGGRLNYSLSSSDRDALKKMFTDINLDKSITTYLNTTIFGAYDSNVFGAVELLDNKESVSQRYYKISANDVIYATGNSERPLLFKNNDLPGIMLSEAIQEYFISYAVLPGKDIVFYTTNDSVYPLAIKLLEESDCNITIVDTRSSNSYLDKLQGLAIKVYQDARVVSAAGRHRVHMVHVNSKGIDERIQCDILAMSGGFNPNINLQCHLGNKPRYDEIIDALVIDDKQGVTVGSAAGILDLQDKIYSVECFDKNKIADLRKNYFNHDNRLELFDIKNKGFIDFQHDVSNIDISLATREGYTSVEHTKRYTTLGMATDQGKLANFNALKVMSLSQSIPIDKIGTTTYRPPYTPVTMGVFAGTKTGLKVKPIRRIPTYNTHNKISAVYTNVGLWKRPEFYASYEGEDKNKAYLRESKNTRTNVGIIDVSTLGKITVQGPDAPEFVNRLYINGMKKLGVGKIRYGLMLREDGVPYDDGTALRISENEYLLTTTTAHAVDVLSHMEHLLQVTWPDLNVFVNTATDQWASIAISGPNSRKVLENIFAADIQLDNKSFPFMTFRDFSHNGIYIRLARISFSGELGYEIMVPAHYGENLWNTLLEAGKDLGLSPYGTEAMGAMRIEKGFITHAEMDGRVTIHQLGMTSMISKIKTDFIGKYYSENRRVDTSGEPVIVGLKATDKNSMLSPGYHLVDSGSLEPQNSLGWVSSSTWSVALDEYIAIGFLVDGNKRLGDVVYAFSPLDSNSVAMEVVSLQFYDPKGLISGEKTND